MRRVLSTLAVIGFFVLVATSDVFARKWTDITGKYTIEAELVDAKDGVVRLKRADGETISIPLEKLSLVDQQFVKMQDGNSLNSIVNLIADEWTIKYALTPEAGSSPDAIIQLAVESQAATIEQRYALCMAMLNTPLSRASLAYLRKVNSDRGNEFQIAKSELGLQELKLTSVKLLGDKAKVEQERNRVVAAAGNLDGIDARYANRVLAVEMAANKAMTAQMASALVRFHVARANSHTEVIALAENDIELQLHSGITAARAKFLTKAISTLTDLQSDMLAESRKRARTLIKEAIEKNPDFLKAHAKAIDRETTASGDRLMKERKRVWALITNSTK